MQVWLPALVEQHRDRVLRVAPLVHSGELLGVVLCARTAEQPPFNEEEERVLTELARQVALALHNSALDTALQASLVDLRFANEELRASRARIVETAIYFCCLEALQNAGKHAGESARIKVRVEADDQVLRFAVVDDGAGFDTASDTIRGHGFVNMADRLGAIGGTLCVESVPGRGT